MGACLGKPKPAAAAPAPFVPAVVKSNEKESTPVAETVIELESGPDSGRIRVEDIWKLYPMVKKLGTGGYGSVVEVEEADNPTSHWAMKMVDKTRGGKDYGERFWEEADLLTELEHPNILKYHDAVYDNCTYYLLTELLRGGELLDFILEKKSFSERDASSLVKTVLTSLKYLHDQDMVHLDLKPENFVFSGPAEDTERLLKIIDFGCAHKVPDNEECNVRTGTPYYIAPEMLTRRVVKTGKVLRACDMWSMGVVCYILVTGRLPFFGSSRKAILQSVLDGKFSFPEDVSLSSSIRGLIKSLLNSDIQERLTVDQALAHPWISDIDSVSSEPLHPTVIAGIKGFRRDSELKKCLAALLVSELTDEDKVMLQEMFNEWDVNRDGVLTQEELVKMTEKFGYDKLQAVEVARALVKEFDLDKDGVIDLDEFAAIGTRGMLALNGDFVNELFDYIDKDGNGYCTVEELELYFHERPDFRLEMDVMIILEEADVNKDGQISREEFLTAMQIINSSTQGVDTLESGLE